MLTQKSFETISFQLATLRFNEWTKELTEIVQEAMTEALNEDGRLCLATKQAIGDRFIDRMKKKGIQREFERERKLRHGTKPNK